MNRLRIFLVGFVKSFSIASFIFFFLLVLLLQTVGQTLWSSLRVVNAVFSESSGRTPLTLLAELGGGVWRSQSEPYPTRRWLLLGTDEVEGSNRQDVLTDTIILVTYQPKENAVRLLSFPRDLYLPDQQSKINSLYRDAIRSKTSHPEEFVSEAVSAMIGQSVDAPIVLSLAQVKDLIDRMGGVPIEVQNTFTDERFPRAGVDVAIVRDPKILYETLHFEQGWQIMDGETAVKYMRSRYANEFEEQGDQARMRRQKQVIAAVAQRLILPEVVGNPILLGNLYDWYASNFMNKMPLYELGWLVGSISNKGIPTMQTVVMPVTEYPVATDEATLFVHPPDSKYQQWVYEPVDPTWGELRQFILDNGL